MSGNVVMIVPSGSEGFNAFQAVAAVLREKVYPGAVIVYATPTRTKEGLHTTYSSKHGRYDWNTAHNLSRVLTISHAGVDGPIFAYESRPDGRYPLQPWGWETPPRRCRRKGTTSGGGWAST